MNSDDTEGRAVCVGLLDSGTVSGHMEAPVDFCAVSQDGYEVTRRPPFDADGHGTVSTALIGARAPQVRLACAAVLGGGNLPARVLAGLDWLADVQPHIACLPLGFLGPERLLARGIDALRQQGCVVVAAAGNAGAGCVSFPAAYPTVVSVGAAETEGPQMDDSYAYRVARFSGSRLNDDGTTCGKPEFVVPAVDLVVEEGDDQRRHSGTSQAAAIFAGEFARLCQGAPQFEPNEILAAIVATAVPPASIDHHRVRYGLVRFAAARALLESGWSRSSPSTTPVAPACAPTGPVLDKVLYKAIARNPHGLIDVILEFTSQVDRDDFLTCRGVDDDGTEIKKRSDSRTSGQWCRAKAYRHFPMALVRIAGRDVARLTIEHPQIIGAWRAHYEAHHYL